MFTKTKAVNVQLHFKRQRKPIKVPKANQHVLCLKRRHVSMIKAHP